MDGIVDTAKFMEYSSTGQLRTVLKGYPDRSKIHRRDFVYNQVRRLKEINMKTMVRGERVRTFSYDTCGNRTENYLFDSFGEALLLKDYQYDQLDRLKKVSTRDAMDDQTPGVETISYRNGENREIKIKVDRDPGGSIKFWEKKFIVYYENDRPVRLEYRTRHSPKANWEGFTKLFRYDAENRIRTVLVYDKNAEPPYEREELSRGSLYHYDCRWRNE